MLWRDWFKDWPQTKKHNKVDNKAAISARIAFNQGNCHRRNQGGHDPSKFWEYLVNLCFWEAVYQKNTVASLKSKTLLPPIFCPQKNFGIATPLATVLWIPVAIMWVHQLVKLRVVRMMFTNFLFQWLRRLRGSTILTFSNVRHNESKTTKATKKKVIHNLHPYFG